MALRKKHSPLGGAEDMIDLGSGLLLTGTNPGKVAAMEPYLMNFQDIKRSAKRVKQQSVNCRIALIFCLVNEVEVPQ